MATYDSVVIGAGVFGAWTAHHLVRAGQRVLLIDAYGAANSRASSGGESRIIRMGYGADDTYTRMSKRSLAAWKELFERTRRPLFLNTGVLWLAREGDPRFSATIAALEREDIRHEKLGQQELARRYPQISTAAIRSAVLEPDSGVILARRAVQTVVDDAVRSGLEYRRESVENLPAAAGYVYACGAWLPKLFPELLGNRIFPTRQEVFFFGTPPGDRQHVAPAMPTWIDSGSLYGMPDIESRGFKIANDEHGPPIDPDVEERVVTMDSVARMRTRLADLFPGLKDAPLVEARVCQYENTSNGDLLIDHHPERSNVWLVGGGSGHGFKHGPAVGVYVAAMITGSGTTEPRFSLATKTTRQARSVY